MNIKIILTKFRSLMFKTFKFVRETFSLPYVKLYLLASIFLTALFIVFTFPYEILLRKQLSKLENTVVSTFYLGSIDLNLFSASYLSNVYILMKNGAQITMKEIIYDSFTPSSVIFPGRQKASLEINGVKYIAGESQIDFTINSNIDLNFDTDTGYPEKGNANFIFQNATLKIDQITLPPQMGGFVINPPLIRFNSVKIDSTVINKKIEIRNSLFSGPDLKGSIKGDITLEKIFNNSVINLRIEIDPQSGILAKYKDLLAGLVKEEKFTLLVKGTLANPTIEVMK